MTRAKRARPSIPCRQAGIGIVTAIFLLVVLSGLGVAMVTMVSAQQASSTLDLLGARAYQAARAGAEWGLYRQLRDASCPVAPQTFIMPQTSSLAAFTVTVTCTETLMAGAPQLTRYRISSVACNQAGAGGCPNQNNSPDYVQRSVEVQF